MPETGDNPQKKTLICSNQRQNMQKITELVKTVTVRRGDIRA